MRRLIRVIDPIHYDAEKREFKSLAFKSLRDRSHPEAQPGISVFDQECSERASATVCQHINRYYAHLSSQPPVHLPIDETDCPPECRIETSVSNTGDQCHYDLIGWPEAQARRFLKNKPLSEFLFCDENGSRPTYHEELNALRLARKKEKGLRDE